MKNIFYFAIAFLVLGWISFILLGMTATIFGPYVAKVLFMSAKFLLSGVAVGWLYFNIR